MNPNCPGNLPESGCLCPAWGKDFFPVGWDSPPGLSSRTDAWFRWSRLTPNQGLFQCLDRESLSLSALQMDWG